MTCLLNVYVASSLSGVDSDRFARGANASSDPRREQIEQLHESALSICSSTSNATFPQ
jgi:hypothetical protein